VSEEVAVPRSPVVIRTATITDLPLLLEFSDDLVGIGGRAERVINPFVVSDLETRLREVVADSAHRVVLACVDDLPVGMAVLRVTRPDPLSTGRMVHLSHVVVARRMRRRGVGQALVEAAADFAIERHVDHVAVGVYPASREVSRFYARLGFAPAVVHRIASATTLRRRLAKDRQSIPHSDVVRRRTRLLRPVPPQRLARSADGERSD
jgi:GNAT superfamily N-acetyltransferase